MMFFAVKVVVGVIASPFLLVNSVQYYAFSWHSEKVKKQNNNKTKSTRFKKQRENMYNMNHIIKNAFTETEYLETTNMYV